MLGFTPTLGQSGVATEKVICSVANGRKRRKFFVWWPMEGEGEGSFLPLPTFPPSNFT